MAKKWVHGIQHKSYSTPVRSTRNIKGPRETKPIDKSTATSPDIPAAKSPTSFNESSARRVLNTQINALERAIVFRTDSMLLRDLNLVSIRFKGWLHCKPSKEEKDSVKQSLNEIVQKCSEAKINPKLKENVINSLKSLIGLLGSS